MVVVVGMVCVCVWLCCARACMRVYTCMFISACMCVVRRESVPIPLFPTTSEFNVVYMMHHVDGSVCVCGGGGGGGGGRRTKVQEH